MRRKFAQLALLAGLLALPSAVQADDREVAQQIMQELKEHRDAGRLKGFNLDMKVEDGVVMFRGQVSDATQRDLILRAAKGKAGVSSVVDRIAVNEPDVPPVVVDRGNIAQAAPRSDFSLKRALQDVTPVAFDENREQLTDGNLRDAIVQRLGEAKKSGKLSGFGVEVKVNDGIARVQGRVLNQETRKKLIEVVRATPGVQRVEEEIRVEGVAPASHSGIAHPTPTRQASAAPIPSQYLRSATPVRPAIMQTTEGGYSGGIGTPMPAHPVPGSPGCAAGGPHYDGPNLPNYAWPGYASYPNYAALSYPQQYSPTAWPYIGPFYPYPQVPLGWRRVTLEWDDGWWMLDFTDR